ncbi:MAG: metallophosphoesterase family protein [Trueperaceae bacterium]|nr:metallophosphoesterase family protein [Trueperaceae bacterium]
MRIAVLGDIHGNLPALEAVLADVELHAADRVIVNGDSVNRGPQGDAVMARVELLAPEMTLGNHDDLLCRLVDDDGGLPDDFRRRPFWEANRWCARQLVDSRHLESLRGLPMTIAIDPPGAPRVLVSHGSPRHFREGYGRFTTDEVISEIVEMHPADVLVGSHTHRPLARRWGRVSVLNTGAVGSPFNGDPRAQYLLLTLAGGVWVPTFRRIVYDVDAALEAYSATGYLAAGGLLASLFHDEVRDARSYLVPFQMWSEERGHALEDESWERFRRAVPDRFGASRPRPTVSESVPADSDTA